MTKYILTAVIIAIVALIAPKATQTKPNPAITIERSIAYPHAPFVGCSWFREG